MNLGNIGRTKNFIVKSLGKCGMPGDIDCPVVYTNDPEFSESFTLMDIQTLGGNSSCPDSCNVRIQFQQSGVVESLDVDCGVIRLNSMDPARATRFSFKASDLYFDEKVAQDPYNCTWSDIKVGSTVFFTPFRKRGVILRAEAAPLLQRALSVTLNERVITCRIGSDHHVPQGVIAIPKWMWPSLCPLTASESAAAAVGSPMVAAATSTSAADADDPKSVAADAPSSLSFTLDGLRDRTVVVTLVYSSELPVISGARLHCVSKHSLNPEILRIPNFTELTNWDDTFKFLTSSGVILPPATRSLLLHHFSPLTALPKQIRKVGSDGQDVLISKAKSGYFSFTAGGRIVVTYCGFVSVGAFALPCSILLTLQLVPAGMSL
jgi:hypothetical protein